MAVDQRAAAPRNGRPPLQGTAAGRRGPAPSANWPPSGATSFDGGFTTPVLALLRRAARAQPRRCWRRTPPGTASPSPRTARPRWPRSCSPASWRTAPGASPPPCRTRCGSTGPSASGGSSSPTSWSTRRRCAGSSAELAADPDFRFVCYVDSVRGVELMDEALRAAGTPARSRSWSSSARARAPAPGRGPRPTASAVADAVAAARHAAAGRGRRLRGRGAAKPTPSGSASWLRAAGRAGRATSTRRAGSTGRDEIVVSAGGSAWFDAVAEVFAHGARLLPAGAEAAALRRVRLPRRRPLPRRHAVQPGAADEGAL